jgi:hypothetical protein
MTPGFSVVRATYTHIFISAMDLSGGDKKGQKRCCDRPPCEAPLADAANFPQLSRLTGRRQLMRDRSK